MPLESSRPAELTERFLADSLDLHFAVHTDGRIYMLNPPRWHEMVGHLLADDARWDGLIAGAAFDQVRDAADQLRSGEPARQQGLDVPVECTDGSVHWFLWSAWRDEVSGIVYGSGKDITERKEMEEGFRLFSDLAEHMRTHPTVESAFELVLERLCSFSGWEQGEGWVVRGEELRLETTWHRGLAGGRESSGRGALRLGESLAGQAWATGSPCWSHDAPSTGMGVPSSRDAFATGGCSLAIPIIVNQGVVAILQLGRRPPMVSAAECQELQARYEAAASALAVQLGTLLERRRAWDELATASEELRRSEERFRTLVQYASDAVSVIEESGTVVFVSPGIERITGFGPEHYLGTNASAHLYPRDWSVEDRELLRTCPDPPQVREGRIAHADGSWRWVEVTQRDCLGDPSIRGIVTNVHDVTERREAEQAARRWARQQATVAELGHRALSSELLPLLVEEAAENIRSVLEDVEVTIRHGTGEPAGQIDVWEEENGIGNVLVFPIGVGRHARGAIEVTKPRAAFADDEVDFLRSVAAILCAAVERELAEAAVIHAEEDARRLIAEDIHDDPLQVMIALGIRLGLLEERLELEDDRRLVRGASADAHEAATRLRWLMFDLHPRSLNEAGLEATLLATLQYGAEQSGFEYEFEYSLAWEPLAATRITIFRIAQEAITNVRLHAEADEVKVIVELQAGGTRCCIRDDGRGMSSVDDGAPFQHLGLQTMRHRAERAGGWCRLDSRLGFGTSVDFWIPDRGYSDEASDG
jgi:PAS domain S-box-containing protein